MSARFGYTTRDSITEDLAAQLRAAADEACDHHDWSTCEPIWFMPELKDGRLDGSSKLLIGFEDLDSDDFDEDALDGEEASGAAEPGAISDARFIADTLASLSSRFGVAWILNTEGEPGGHITGGMLDDEAQRLIEGLEALGDLL